MKIIDVSLTLFEWTGLPETGYGKLVVSPAASDLALLTLQTDEGIEGHSFLGSSIEPAHLDARSLIDFLKPVVLNQDPLDRERLYQAMMVKRRFTTHRALGAVDVALWDIAGKVVGQPIHRLLGTFRNRVPAYASSSLLPSVNDYVDDAIRFKDAGWFGYKIHPPTDPSQDIMLCRAVREAVGPDFTLMLDSLWAYQYPDALRVGQAIEELGYLWYEDPLAEDDIFGYVKLKQHLKIPILATEYAPGGLTGFAPWIVHRATDFLRGDVALKGGITGLVKVAHLAEAFHMNIEIHHGGNSINNVANLHVMLAIRNSSMFEVLLPVGLYNYGLESDLEVDADGYVRALDGPGLGVTPDFPLIQRRTLTVLQ